LCIALLAAKLSELAGLGGREAPWVDNVLSAANLAACAVYVYPAIGPAYGAAGAPRVGTAIVLASAAAIVLGYRFLLFLITLCDMSAGPLSSPDGCAWQGAHMRTSKRAPRRSPLAENAAPQAGGAPGRSLRDQASRHP
jgi:hypothetical protein